VAAPLTVLVVDDNRSSADALARLLRKQGDAVSAVYDGQSAIDRIRTNPPDVVLTDLKMEPVDGMAVLQVARSQRPPIETIVFTAYGAVDVAVQAMHLGARDFLTKPVTVEQVSTRLDQLRSEVENGGSLAESESVVPDEDEFVALSDSSRQLLLTLERAAGVPSAVLLEGEIGSGRSYCASTLHRLGAPDAPLTFRNLGRDEPWPASGTVVLPGVDDLADDLQLELYRQLQDLPEGVRLVATARPDGRRRVAEGELRPELYYQLAVVVIPVPPLRRRPEDIVPLFRRGLRMYAQRYGRPEPELSPRLRDQLERHYWPGNIRELSNLAERTVVLGEDGFNLQVVEDPGAGMPKLEVGFSLSDYLETVERRILIEALRRCGGDRTAAGRLLGVERNTLRYKLNKYDLLDK
jgi:two-component system, NtrC family, response regulator HydG